VDYWFNHSAESENLGKVKGQDLWVLVTDGKPEILEEAGLIALRVLWELTG
jgi:hypothetical protein